MLVWGGTLLKLYRDIDHSRKLLPNKRVFILHGSILSVYVLLFSTSQILQAWLHHTPENNTKLIFSGICDLLICPENALELLTYFLVVKLMLPTTQYDKEKRSKFQRFLFKGFADKD